MNDELCNSLKEYDYYVSTLRYLEDYISAELANYLFIPTFYLEINNMTVHNISCNVLTDKQGSFLLNKKLLDVINEDSFSYTYITDLFVNESSNIPLEDSVFLYSIFAFVNLYLYIHASEYIVASENKEYNLAMLPKVGMTFSNGDISSSKDVFVGFKYNVHTHKKTLKLGITLYSNVFSFVIPIDIPCLVYSHTSVYKVDNPNEFLFKVITIYEDIIEAMLNE